jgi:hypothetical protein
MKEADKEPTADYKIARRLELKQEHFTGPESFE